MFSIERQFGACPSACSPCILTASEYPDDRDENLSDCKMEKPYHDASALADYVHRYGRHFMSDLEKRGLRYCGIAARIEGFKQDEFEGIREIAIELELEFIRRGIPDDVKTALALGYEVYREQIHQRLLREALEGRLPINRCPKCGKIVRTPTAKQCRWCLFAWHDA